MLMTKSAATIAVVLLLGGGLARADQYDDYASQQVKQEWDDTLDTIRKLGAADECKVVDDDMSWAAAEAMASNFSGSHNMSFLNGKDWFDQTKEAFRDGRRKARDAARTGPGPCDYFP